MIHRDFLYILAIGSCEVVVPALDYAVLGIRGVYVEVVYSLNYCSF